MSKYFPKGAFSGVIEGLAHLFSPSICKLVRGFLTKLTRPRDSACPPPPHFCKTLKLFCKTFCYGFCFGPVASGPMFFQKIIFPETLFFQKRRPGFNCLYFRNEVHPVLEKEQLGGRLFIFPLLLKAIFNNGGK